MFISEDVPERKHEGRDPRPHPRNKGTSRYHFLPHPSHHTGPPAGPSQHPHPLPNCLHQALTPTLGWNYPSCHTCFSLGPGRTLLSQKTGSNPVPTLKLPPQEFFQVLQVLCSGGSRERSHFTSKSEHT